MRVLAATTGGAGHLGPMLPFLRACVADGHDLLLVAPGDWTSDEFPSARLPETPPEILGPIFGSLPSMTREEANVRVLRDVFGGANVDATLDAHVDIVASWRPDLVLRESAELGSYVAATRAGVPIVQVAIGLRRSDETIHAALDGAFQERYGADPAGLLTSRTLTLVPPSMETPGGVREAYRDPSMTGGDGTLPEGLPRDDRPLVYVTFGSIAASLGPFAGIYREALDALAEVDARVLMTTGSAGDPESLDPLPPNAFVTKWAPQAAVLREASVVVGHGGFGTTYGTLAAGVPTVVLPLFSHDQFINADAIEAAGAGMRVADAAALGEAVNTLLADDAARSVARRIAGEMASLPEPSGWVERG